MAPALLYLCKKEKKMWFSKKSVLVIDDDASIRVIVKNRLSVKDNLIVFVSGNAIDGIEIAEKENPDLIILDWMMPEVNGLQTLKTLKQHQELHQIPVIMLTGNKLIGDVEKAFSLGAKAYLTKPLDLVKLSQKVSQII